MKPKANRAGDTSQAGAAGYDCCQTPPYALDPLLPYVRPSWRVWEPAAGDGLMADALRAHGCEVITTDIQSGADFFAVNHVGYDVLITNPPYSLKYAWLERCYELGRPFALLVPLEMLGAAKCQKLTRRHGVEVMLLSRRVNFKMPGKGWDGGGAQFPVVWLSWRLTGQPLGYGDITPRAINQTTLQEAA